MSEKEKVYEEPDRRCESCGKYDECQLHKKTGRQICYSCAERYRKEDK